MHAEKSSLKQALRPDFCTNAVNKRARLQLRKLGSRHQQQGSTSIQVGRVKAMAPLSASESLTRLQDERFTTDEGTSVQMTTEIYQLDRRGDTSLRTRHHWGDLPGCLLFAAAIMAISAALTAYLGEGVLPSAGEHAVTSNMSTDTHPSWLHADAALASQLTKLTYGSPDLTTDPAFAAGNEFHLATHSACRATRTVACHGGNQTWEVTLPVDGCADGELIATTPSFCAWHVYGVGTVLAFRGTAVKSDVSVDVLGAFYQRTVTVLSPGGVLGTARVHGASYDAYSSVRTSIRALVTESLAPNDVLIVTGHSLGGMFATYMANDLGLAIHSGELPSIRLRLLTFGKPFVGDAAFAAGLTNLCEIGLIEVMGRWVLATASGMLDPITTLTSRQVSGFLPGFGSGTIGSVIDWTQEAPLHTLPCRDEINCHSMIGYAQSAVHAADDVAAELTLCEQRHMLAAPYTGLSLCGRSLEHVVNDQGWTLTSSTSKCKGDVVPLEERSFPAFLAAVLQICIKFLVAAMISTAAIRAIAGDRHWWAGPYLILPEALRRSLATIGLMDSVSRPLFRQIADVREQFLKQSVMSAYTGTSTSVGEEWSGASSTSNASGTSDSERRLNRQMSARPVKPSRLHHKRMLSLTQTAVATSSQVAFKRLHNGRALFCTAMASCISQKGCKADACRIRGSSSEPYQPSALYTNAELHGGSPLQFTTSWLR